MRAAFPPVLTAMQSEAQKREFETVVFAEGEVTSLGVRREADSVYLELTAVGEVPPQTLRSFAQSLERRR